MSGCAILIRKDALRKIAYLDEGYFLYGDDIDLSISIRRLKMGLLFVPSAISWHKVSSGKQKAPRFTYQMKAKCDLRLILKNFPMRFVPSALFFKGVLFPLSEALYFYRNPRFLLLAAQAFLTNMKELKDTFESRRRADKIGKAVVKNRFPETIREAIKRIKEMKLYW